MHIQKWEYFIAAIAPDKSMQFAGGYYKSLAAMGDNGWELAGVMPSAEPGFFNLVMKRPKP